jgi:hypothetical protein
MDSNLDLVTMVFNIGGFNFSIKAQEVGAWVLAILMFWFVCETVITMAIAAVKGIILLWGFVRKRAHRNARPSRPLSAPSVDVIDHRLADESEEQR